MAAGARGTECRQHVGVRKLEEKRLMFGGDFVGEPGNRVILEIREAGHISISPRRMLIDRAEILKLSELASVLMDRVDKQMGELCESHVRQLPAIGKYVIDLKSQSFLPYSPGPAGVP